MWRERTRLVIKDEGIHKLEQSHVLVVGLGGVGAFVAEFLARAGVGQLTIVDGDVVDTTNKTDNSLPLILPWVRAKRNSWVNALRISTKT